MRDEQGGRAVRRPNGAQGVLQADTREGIERAERFIEQQRFGSGREGAGNRRALRHAAGNLVRVRPLETAQPHQINQFGDARIASHPRPEAEADVLRQR